MHHKRNGIRWTLLSVALMGGCAQSNLNGFLSFAKNEPARPTISPAQSDRSASRQHAHLIRGSSSESTIQTVSHSENLISSPSDLSATPAQEPVSTSVSSSTVTAATPPLEPTMTAAPLAPIDWESVFALTQSQNTDAAIARARIRQAYAEWQSAQVLWLPSIRAGLNYNKHEGRIQDVAGQNIEASRGAAFGGLGAGAVGAASPAIPGVSMQFHLTDAIYQPRIAGYVLQARKAQSRIELHAQQLAAALAYLQLLDAAQQQSIAEQNLEVASRIAEQLQAYLSAGTANQLTVSRSQLNQSALQQQKMRAQEAYQVASIQLAQILCIDPQASFAPQDPQLIPLELVDLQMTPNELVAAGLSQRPELAEQHALVCEAINRLRREQNASWVPSVALGMSHGAFGAGVGSDISNGSDRWDFDGMAYWEVRNFGLGDKAAQRSAASRVDQARLSQVGALNKVACEIMAAYHKCIARRQRISIAEQAAATASQNYLQEQDRLQNNLTSVEQVISALELRDTAQREYLRAVVEYNAAQFELQHALGWL